MTTILCCEDSLEGIFSGVYQGWAGGYGHANVKLQLGELEDMEFFADYLQVATDEERAQKVERTIRRRMSTEVYEVIAEAALSRDPGRGTAIYQLIVCALSMRQPGRVLEVLTDPGVLAVTKLAKNVWNEAHHLLGFARFEEMANGVLLSVIGPKNRVLPIVAPHFEDRLPLENWAIYDRTHEEFALHTKGRHWVLVRGERLAEDMKSRLSEEELEFQMLWKNFCGSILIQERRNEQLQLGMLPKRFRKYMTEFE